MKKSVFAGVAISLFVVSAPSFAQETHLQPGSTHGAKPNGSSGLSMGKHNSKAPLDISSDAFEGELETKEGIYSGNVIVTQEDYKLRADKVSVKVVDGKPDKVIATGNVVFATPSGTATGDDGVYDLADPPTVTLRGRVVLTKEKNVMRGTQLVVNTDTGIAHLTAQGDRVHAILQPVQKAGSGSKKPTGGSAPPGG